MAINKTIILDGMDLEERKNLIRTLKDYKILVKHEGSRDYFEGFVSRNMEISFQIIDSAGVRETFDYVKLIELVVPEDFLKNTRIIDKYSNFIN
jgi:hypothetical protein